MILKLNNITIIKGDKMRSRQNLTIRIIDIDEDTTINDIKQILEIRYNKILRLNASSTIQILKEEKVRDPYHRLIRKRNRKINKILKD
jgi:hypothetical protein